MDPKRIPEHSRFLLEIDTEILKTSDYESQVYWVTAMEAAPRPSALMNSTASQPALSTFGSFTLQATIVMKMSEMFGNRQIENQGPRTQHMQNSDMGLTKSD